MAQTIKEFLVSLGFKVDGNSEARFSRSIEVATKGAIALGAAVAAASTAVTAAVTKIAAGFDDLYYASQRTKASAENIKAVGFAVSQLGGSYQGVVASIEAFALKMRSNPGYEGMAKSLGVVTRENGRLKDTTVLMTDLARALSRKPEYIRLQYLEALGIDDATYKALSSGDLVRYTEEYRRKQEALGVSQSRAAEIGKDLTNAWRSLGATAAAVGDKLLVSLGPGIKDFVDRIDAFLVRNADKIVGFFERAAEWIGKLLTAFIQLVEKGEGPLVEFFDKMVKGVEQMQIAFAAFATFLGGAFLLSVLGAFAKVGGGFAAMLLKLGINPLTLGAIGIGGLAAGAYALNESDKDFNARRNAIENPGGRNPFAAIDERDAKRFPKDDRNWWQRTAPKWLGGKDAPSAVGNSTAPIHPGSFSDKAPGIMKRLQEDFGFTKEQAAGVLGNLGHESGGLKVMQEVNPVGGGRGGYGWAQWTGPRRRAFEAWATEKGLDINSDEANYGFLKHELSTNHKNAVAAVKAASTAQEAMVAFENTYERAGIKAWGSRQKWTERALAAANAPQSAAPANAGAATGSDYAAFAADYAKATGGRNLTKDMAGNPHLSAWAERMVGRKMPATPADEGSPYIKPEAKAPSEQGSPFISKLDPEAFKRVQLNAATIGGDAQPGGGAPLMPPASNTNLDLQQKTEITILGGGDPQATAQAVAGAQDRVNGGLIRNMQGAVR